MKERNDNHIPHCAGYITPQIPRTSETNDQNQNYHVVQRMIRAAMHVWDLEVHSRATNPTFIARFAREGQA